MSNLNLAMLWFENDGKKTLEQVLSEAVKYYKEKYGATPNAALVPLSAPDVVVPGLSIQKSRYVKNHHVLVGVVGSSGS